MSQEPRNDPAAETSGANAESSLTSPAADKGLPGAQAPARRRVPRRSTSAPTTLKQAAALLHTAPASASEPAGSRSEGAESGPPESGGRGRRPGTAGPGLIPKKAAEDDPRAWGDRPDDVAAWLKEQRPPHWG
ncbi:MULTISPECIES: hypothetical protein [Arthrobacter]|uniref:hypothetical protein n=1 Tax=Arthrobacter TaxID=1663 RepID=UPI000B1C1408|nr:hypothetical protein [Arthrobacter sp. Edens01]